MPIYFLSLFLAFARPAAAASVNVVAYDAKGRLLDASTLAVYIGRADKKPGGQAVDVVAEPADGSSGFARVKLSDAKHLSFVWTEKWPAQFSLVWPVADDGFSNVWIDKDGAGFSDGDTVNLNEAIAQSQFRYFKEGWLKRTRDWNPIYHPGSKAVKLEKKAEELMSAAQGEKNPILRAAAFDKALTAVSAAWQKMLVEHGAQTAATPRLKEGLRFGLTLDESFGLDIDNYKWVIESIARSRANWVRLVFRANPADFLYARPRSFTVYDSIVSELRAKNIRVMGTVLDTAQWPKDLTPALFSERTRNLVLHYSGKIGSWEVGSEINGDWLGGSKTPLGLDKTFLICAAGAKAVKTVDPSLETVASLYWWDATAPDENHSLFGWLRRYAPEGFANDLDVLGLDVYPEDNPAGMAFERMFDRAHDALPQTKLMLGSFGFVEKKDLLGYWWFDPADIDGARKDLMVYMMPASAAAVKSLGGGFWWQTLDQMLLPHRKATDLFYVFRRALEDLDR